LAYPRRFGSTSGPTARSERQVLARNKRRTHLPRGVIVATCNLVDCRPTDEMTQGEIEFEKHFGDFTPGRYAWILDDVKPLDVPVPAKGKQGLWNWDEVYD